MTQIISIPRRQARKTATEITATDAYTAGETIRPLSTYMTTMDPADLTDYCLAVCSVMRDIERTKDYSYFSDSAKLACRIGAAYVYTIKGHDVATGQKIRPAAAAKGK